MKRIGNLGEMAFECFCREYLPVEMWEWLNAEDVRRCNPESYSSYDFEVFGYEVDVKTSRDYHPGILASYCYDQDVKLYNYKHTNIQHADDPYVVGDLVVKSDRDDQDLVVVVERDGTEVTFEGQFDGDLPRSYVSKQCDEDDIKLYSYDADELEFADV